MKIIEISGVIIFTMISGVNFEFFVNFNQIY